MLNIISKINWFIKRKWKTYLLVFILLIISGILQVAPAYFLGVAVDLIISAKLDLRGLIYLIIVFVSIPIIRYINGLLYNYLNNKMANELSYELKNNYLSHLFQMDLSFFEKYEKGDLLSRITTDLEAIVAAATNLFDGLVFNVSLILFAIFQMGVNINLNLTLISITIMPIGISILSILRNKKRKYFETHRKIYANMTEKILESIEGQKTIRAYNQEKNNLLAQQEAMQKDIVSWKYIVDFENWFSTLFDCIYAISYLLAIGFGIFYVINAKITLGMLVTFVSYVGLLYGPILAIPAIFSQINNASISFDRYYEILNEKPLITNYLDSKNILDFNEIEFKDVTFKYPFDKNAVLKDISFKIKKGETIGIVGPTGAGKSTLIRQLLREFNVTLGSILIDNIPIDQYVIKEVRNLVGYVPQSHILFKREVLENIKIGKPYASNLEMQKAIMIADFKKDIDFLEKGINTMVGEFGSTLSGGQKQRLSIVRALVKNPEILILDDSLSAVDGKTESNIIQMLDKFRKDKTNIIVSHRFSAVKDAHLILVLKDGKIIQKGTHEELLNQNGWYKDEYINQTMIT